MGQTYSPRMVPSDAYRSRRVFVTGATGLIGSQLVLRLLESSAVVHVLAIPEAEPHSALIRSSRLGDITIHRRATRMSDVLTLLQAFFGIAAREAP